MLENGLAGSRTQHGKPQNHRIRQVLFHLVYIQLYRMSPQTSAFIDWLRHDRFDPNDHLPWLLKEEVKKLEGVHDAKLALPEVFRFFERHPLEDFGVPGDLVFFVERHEDYLPLLLESVHRRPMHYTVWMLNRAINGDCDFEQRIVLLDAIHSVISHPAASEGDKENARSFLRFQAGEQLEGMC